MMGFELIFHLVTYTYFLLFYDGVWIDFPFSNPYIFFFLLYFVWIDFPFSYPCIFSILFNCVWIDFPLSYLYIFLLFYIELELIFHLDFPEKFPAHICSLNIDTENTAKLKAESYVIGPRQTYKNMSCSSYLAFFLL